MIKKALLTASIIFFPFQAIADLIATDRYIGKDKISCTSPENLEDFHDAMNAGNLDAMVSMANVCAITPFRVPLENVSRNTKVIWVGDERKEAINFHRNGGNFWTLVEYTNYEPPAKSLVDEQQAPIIKTTSTDGLSIVGNWKCVTTNPDNTQSKDHYEFRNSGYFSSKTNGTTVSGDFKQSGEELSLTFLKIDYGNHRANAHVNITAQATIETATNENLVFTTFDVSSNQKRIVRCKTAPVVAAAKQKRPTNSVVTPSQDSFATKYGRNLANQLAQGHHPACQVVAQHIRNAANSSARDSVKIRQIESMFDKAPSVCL